MGILDQRANNIKAAKSDFPPFTVGTVVDTNDPAQMGRIRVQCVSYRDPPTVDNETERNQIPWATYVTPFGGVTNNIKRGPTQTHSNDRVAYGMWAIPKLGAQVICGLIDNNPDLRIWIGCIFPIHSAHSLPHGRYMDGKASPMGSTEKPIEPMTSNMTKSFGGDASKYEWKSRAGDYSVAAVDIDLINEGLEFTETTTPDDKDVDYKVTSDKTIPGRQGYAASTAIALDGIPHNETKGKAYDSGVYSWTTPGFHAISMDDRPENCRFKIRTTRGHQIIMDDTNERIYINTCEGNNWIELDQNGNIDVYSSRRISFRSEEEMNFNTDKTFRVYAKKGIHLMSEDEIRIHSKKNDIHIRSDKNIRTHALRSIYEQADNDMHRVTTNGSMYTTSGDSIETTSTTETLLTAQAGFHIKATNNIVQQAGESISANAGESYYITAADEISVLSSDSIIIQAGGNAHISALGSLLVSTTTAIHLASTQHIFLESKLNTSIKAAEKVLVSGKELHSTATTVMSDMTPLKTNNFGAIITTVAPSTTGTVIPIAAEAAGTASAATPAPPALDAFLAEPANEFQAFWTARVPAHEPWNRVMMKASEGDKPANNSHVPEFGYDDSGVGTVERGSTTPRNPFWHR